MSEHLPVNLSEMVGRLFPGGHYTIEPYRAWLMADTMVDVPHPSVVHPVHAWLGATEGMGMTWDDLFAWFDATADDGPMIGEHETQMHQQLQVNVRYEVSGHVVSVQRKRGRSGVFDLVKYQLELHEAAGTPVATCRNTLVFPRGQS